MRVEVWVHGSKEACLDAGHLAGLRGQALEMFAYAANEHKVTYEVDSSGKSTPILIDNLRYWSVMHMGMWHIVRASTKEEAVELLKPVSAIERRAALLHIKEIKESVTIL
jgi:hypothetical protein